MIRVRSEHTSDSHDALSEDAVGMHVLGRKSGYIRGMGHGPKPPPVRNIHCSGCAGSRSREVQLQQQVENLMEKIEQIEVERNILSSKVQYMEAEFSSKVNNMEAQQAQLLKMFEEFRSTRTSST